MRIASIVALCLALTVGLFAFSQDSSARPRRDNLPPGTYKKTCKDIKVTDRGMHAVCKTMDGRWRKTFIPASEMSCPNGIENLDGKLICPRG